jgi:hypothetical protein
MATKGHAEDCPACQYLCLPAVDRRWFAEHGYAPKHHRREPPSKPVLLKPYTPALLVCELAVFGLGMSIAGNAPGLAAPLVLLTLLWFLVCPAIHNPRHHRLHEWCFLCQSEKPRINAMRLRRWRGAVQQWEQEQTQVWLDSRAQGLRWPCPKCGKLECLVHVGHQSKSRVPRQRAVTQRADTLKPLKSRITQKEKLGLITGKARHQPFPPPSSHWREER